MKLLVIGYGNPLRGDDGFGYLAAERIAGAVAVPQLTPELMDAIAQAERVVFLDATVEGSPGELRRRPVGEAAGDAGFTHHATPESLVAGARALYGRAGVAEVWTVCGRDFGIGEELSREVEEAVERVVEEVGLLFADAAVRRNAASPELDGSPFR